MFLNPSLTIYFKMFISTKAGIGALTLNALFLRFNLETQLEMRESLEPIENPIGETFFAKQGELLARIALKDELSPDSKAGKLILRQCNTIWISLVDDSSIQRFGKRKVISLLNC